MRKKYADGKAVSVAYADDIFGYAYGLIHRRPYADDSRRRRPMPTAI